VRDLAKAQDHNGKVGKIIGWDAGKKRYEVELDGETTLSLKPSNLTQQVRVQLIGIESSPELNGCSADVFNYSGGRYMVRLQSKMANGRDVVGINPCNVILPSGTRVVTKGLSKEEFNDQMARIVAIDREALRYTVELENSKQIKIKYDNVLV